MVYMFQDNKGNYRVMSAKKIHKRVMEDSKKSNYNWIADADNLVFVCNCKTFPLEYAIDIKVAILNCFARLMSNTLYKNNYELNPVYSAYNSLNGITDEKVIEARTNFLNAYLTDIMYESYAYLPVHSGKSFDEVCGEWKRKNIENLLSSNFVYFNELIETLSNDFKETIRAEEEKGVFLKDDEEYFEDMKNFMKRLMF